MKFKEYLEGLASGNLEEWVLKNKTTESKFAPYKAKSIMNKVYSEGECPVNKFKVYRRVEELIFGQFIMLEQTLSSDTKFHDKLHALSTIALRPIGDNEFDKEDLEKENKLDEDVFNEECENVLRVVNKLLEDRNDFINNRYKGIFYKATEEGDDNDDGTEDVSNSDNNWYWYSLLKTLSNNDIHKHPDTLMLKMNVVAAEVAYIRNEEQKAEHQRRIDELKNRRR